MGTWRRIHGRVSFGLGRAYVIPKRSHTLYLEGGTRITWHDGGHIDTFLTEDVRKTLQSKAWNSFLNKNFTLGELIFEVLSVTSWSKCLTVPVLLMTCNASRGTSCTFRMFGIALSIGRQVRNVKHGWKLPSVSPDGTCLYFLPPASRTRLVRASKSARLRG